MNPLETELRSYGVSLTPEQWQRYREWAQKNPNGGKAPMNVKPRKERDKERL